MNIEFVFPNVLTLSPMIVTFACPRMRSSASISRLTENGESISPLAEIGGGGATTSRRAGRRSRCWDAWTGNVAEASARRPPIVTTNAGIIFVESKGGVRIKEATLIVDQDWSKSTEIGDPLVR